jgi:general stress protein 26
VEINEAGEIWFAIPKPAQHIDAFEKEIPAKMDFFKKGKDFFVKVRGKAHLITDANEVANAGLSSQLMDKLKQSQVIAVKILVQEAELVDTTPKATQSWIQNGKTQLSSWFF